MWTLPFWISVWFTYPTRNRTAYCSTSSTVLRQFHNDNQT